MKIKTELKKSFLAGVLVAIGGTVYLSCQNKIVGAFLFSVALFCICMENLSLYTGKVCYFLKAKDKGNFLAELLVCLVGNSCAVILCALILKSNSSHIKEISGAMCALKLDKSFSRIFVDSIFCGILIYLAVNIYKERNSLFGIFLCIPVFILSGFEHCIADTFYFFLTENLMFSKMIIFILITILGNTIGGLVFPFIRGHAKSK